MRGQHLPPKKLLALLSTPVVKKGLHSKPRRPGLKHLEITVVRAFQKSRLGLADASLL